MTKKTINSVFDWVKHINQYKTPVDSFTGDDWDKFNSYVVHRVMSMDCGIGLLISNEAQRIHPTDKKGVYSFYLKYIGKNSKYNKYIKSKTKSPNSDLLLELANHYELSQREVKDYIKMLDAQEISRILEQRGIDKKEIKKLLK